MEAQLDASLIGVRNIDSVDLTLNGVDPDAPALANPPVKNPRVDPRTVVYDGEAFGYLATSGEGIDPIAGLSDQVVGLTPTGPHWASAPSRRPCARRRACGWCAPERRPCSSTPGSASWCPRSTARTCVWSVPADAPDQLVWFAPDGTSEQVAVPWSGSSIAAIEVSRDSTRIVALLADGGRTHFVAASIERADDGRPVALGAVALRLADVTGTPLDLTWLDSRSVASITGLADGATRVVTQELGGFAREREGPAGGVMVDGGNADLRVLTADGFLDVQSGVGWQVRAGGIRFVSAQQPD